MVKKVLNQRKYYLSIKYKDFYKLMNLKSNHNK